MLVAGCATVPTRDIKVDAQADPKANFSGYKTYDWLGAAAIVNDAYGRWEPSQFDADAEIVFLTMVSCASAACRSVRWIRIWSSPLQQG
jgi:pyruvate/2-oxoacid:ferredoxin oxidoreductase alpha subunit